MSTEYTVEHVKLAEKVAQEEYGVKLSELNRLELDNIIGPLMDTDEGSIAADLAEDLRTGRMSREDVASMSESGDLLKEPVADYFAEKLAPVEPDLEEIEPDPQETVDSVEILELPTVELVNCKVSKVGLQILGDLNKSEWLSMGPGFAAMGSTVKWIIADWLCYGDRKYGEMYREASEVLGLAEKTLRNLKYVASKVQLSSRGDNLSFTHHREVAAFSPERQKEILSWAAENRASVRMLQDEIKRRSLPDRRAAQEEEPEEPKKKKPRRKKPPERKLNEFDLARGFMRGCVETGKGEIQGVTERFVETVKKLAKGEAGGSDAISFQEMLAEARKVKAEGARIFEGLEKMYTEMLDSEGLSSEYSEAIKKGGC